MGYMAYAPHSGTGRGPEVLRWRNRATERSEQTRRREALFLAKAVYFFARSIGSMRAARMAHAAWPRGTRDPPTPDARGARAGALAALALRSAALGKALHE